MHVTIIQANTYTGIHWDPNQNLTTIKVSLVRHAVVLLATIVFYKIMISNIRHGGSCRTVRGMVQCIMTGAFKGICRLLKFIMTYWYRYSVPGTV